MRTFRTILCFIIAAALAVPAGAVIAVTLVYVTAGGLPASDTLFRVRSAELMPITTCFAPPLLVAQGLVFRPRGDRSTYHLAGFIVPIVALIGSVSFLIHLDPEARLYDATPTCVNAVSVAAIIAWALILALTSRASRNT